MRRKSGIIALLASFSVYLIPLVDPHAAPLLGEMFFGDMYRSRPLWFVTDVAAGFMLQLFAFTVIYLLERLSLFAYHRQPDPSSGPRGTGRRKSRNCAIVSRPR